ncbi:MAG: hypothetical protein ABR906_11080 [Terracidiphilus sp.]|jgi:hypothetical protein
MLRLIVFMRSFPAEIWMAWKELSELLYELQNRKSLAAPGGLAFWLFPWVAEVIWTPPWRGIR